MSDCLCFVRCLSVVLVVTVCVLLTCVVCTVYKVRDVTQYKCDNLYALKMSTFIIYVVLNLYDICTISLKCQEYGDQIDNIHIS